MKEEKQKCCICKKEFIGYGHNAMPLKIGRCCNICNALVIRARVNQLKGGRADNGS